MSDTINPVACPYCGDSYTLGAVYYDQNCAGCVKRMGSADTPADALRQARADALEEAAQYLRDDGLPWAAEAMLRALKEKQ